MSIAMTVPSVKKVVRGHLQSRLDRKDFPRVRLSEPNGVQMGGSLGLAIGTRTSRRYR